MNTEPTTTDHAPDHEALEALVWGSLPAAEAARVSEHADRCPDCAQHRAALVAERAILADVLGPVVAAPVPVASSQPSPAPAPAPAPTPVAHPAPGRFGFLAAGFCGGVAAAVAAVMVTGAFMERPSGTPTAPDAGSRPVDVAVGPEPDATAPEVTPSIEPPDEPTPVAPSEPVATGRRTTMPPRPDGPASPARPMVAEPLGADEIPAIDFSVIGKVSARDANRRDVGDLDLAAVEVEAFIGTGLATTSIEHTFRSRASDVLEGLYEVTIPKGASVERYALSSENGWLEGRYVEREYARRVYESYLPQRRDPGLVEWQDGQRFTARVFPVPAGGDKGVLLGYTEPVAAKNGRVRWTLPLADVLERIGLRDFAATVRIPAPAAGVQGVILRRHPGKATVSRHGDEVVIRIEGRLPAADAIVVDIESPRVPARFHTAPPRSGEAAGYGLVALDPRAFLANDVKPARGADIVFVVDRSGSMEGQQLGQATTQLRDALEQLGPNDRFCVLAFSDEAQQVTKGFLPADPQTAADLASNLHARGTDGGTNYAAAFAGAAGLIAGRGDADRPAIVVILTDGEGFKDIKTQAGAPVFAVPIGTSDRHQLDLSARAHGGSAMGTAAEAIAAAPHRALARVTATFGDGIELVHPQAAAVFDPDAEIVFAFRRDPRRPAPDTITLAVDQDGSKHEVAIDLPRAEGMGPVRAARAWARARITDLLASPGQHRDELSRLGVGYRFVTPFTSLLVLESEEEYERWGLGEDQITEDGKAGPNKEVKTLIARVERLQDQGRVAEAIEAIDEALRVAPDSAQVLLARGTLRERQGDIDAALADFSRALALDPANARAWAERANANVNRGDLVGAMADLDRAIEMAPTSADAIELRARVRATLGDEAGARADEQRLLALRGPTSTDPDGPATVMTGTPTTDGTKDHKGPATKLPTSPVETPPAAQSLEEAQAQIARLSHLKSSLERDLEDSRKQYATSSKQLRDNELLVSMLRDKGVDIESLVYGPPPPAIEGVVVAVRQIEDDPEHPLVLLSVGSNDKVEKGFQFSIHRGSEFIAKVVVEKVMPDMAGCRVLFTRDGVQTIVRPDAKRSPLVERGLVSLRFGLVGEAIAAFSRAIEADASDAEAWLGRARARARAGDRHGAARDLEAYLAIAEASARRETVRATLTASRAIASDEAACEVLRLDALPAEEPGTVRVEGGVQEGDQASTRLP